MCLDVGGPEPALSELPHEGTPCTPNIPGDEACTQTKKPCVCMVCLSQTNLPVQPTGITCGQLCPLAISLQQARGFLGGMLMENGTNVPESSTNDKSMAGCVGDSVSHTNRSCWARV